MTAVSHHESRYSWLRLAMTLAVATVGNVGMWSIIVVMPAVEAEFAVDRADASIPYMLTMLGFALGNALAGRMVDRYGISLALIGSALTIALGKTLGAMADTIWMLSAMQFLIGLGTATSFGPLLADISHWFSRRRGIAVAVTASGNYLSGAIWPVLLSGILEQNGWRAVYLTLAVITLVVVVPLALLLGRRVMSVEAKRAGGPGAGPRPSATGFSNRTLTLLLGLAGIGCCVAMATPQVHIVSFSVDLGFGSAVGAQMLSLMLLGGVVSRLVFGAVSDRLGGLRTVLIGSVLQFLALGLFLPFDTMSPLYAVSLAFGLAQGGIVPAYAMAVRDHMPAEEAATRVGIVMMTTVLGMALGGWLSGWIHDLTGSYRMAFVNSMFWNLGNIAIILAILWRSARPRPATVTV